MGNTLYLECYSGISGDMTAAALLDLGADQAVLLDVLNSLPVKGFQIKISRVKKSGIDACDFAVILDEEHENHDHNMAYLHGTAEQHETAEKDGHEAHQEAPHEHLYEQEAPHEHGHVQEHEVPHGNHHPHEHRGLDEITEIIEQSRMTVFAKKLALQIFQVLAEAEAKAHNLPVEQVHFHEVGAVDSIVDIVTVAVCLDNLGITEVIIPALYEGTGTIRCQHGMLPVPVPAVSNIIQKHGLCVQITDIRGELVTPTGAAIAAVLKTSDALPKNMKINKIGIGAGKRQYECPGILRAMLIERDSAGKDVIYELESNIDDSNGENLGYLMEKLFDAGARDVHYVPAFMKKNRPAWVLHVICKKEEADNLKKIIFEETTTIGIRQIEMERTILKREQRTISTPMGEVEVKICEVYGEKRVYPEYESLIQLCQKNKISYSQGYQSVVQYCKVDEGR